MQDGTQFLEAYTNKDLTIAKLEGSSNSLWTISPPSRDNLINVLRGKEDLIVTMYWSFLRYGTARNNTAQWCPTRLTPATVQPIREPVIS